MRRGFGIALLVLFAATGGAAADEGRPPILAVMSVEPVGLALPAATADRLTVLLTARIGAIGRFQVVPRDQVKRRLVELKRGSYRADCDQSCQIELGQALSAQKTLTCQVIRVGNTCTVALNVFDLKREASEAGASVDGECDEASIGASMKTAVSRVSAEGRAPRAPDPAPAPGPRGAAVEPPPEVSETGPRVRKSTVSEAVGDLAILAKTPSGVPVRLEVTDPSGRTLASASPFKDGRAAVGRWSVVAKANGHESEAREVPVPPDDVTVVKIELKPLGGLKVLGEPPGMAVAVTGPGGFKDEGGLPWEADGLRSGTYEVAGTRTGYVPVRQRVQVEPGRVAEVTLRLEREPSLPRGTGAVALGFPTSADRFKTVSETQCFWSRNDTVDGRRQADLRSATVLRVHAVRNTRICGLAGDDLVVRVSVNGRAVGTFRFRPSDVIVDAEFRFPAIAGPTFDVRFQPERDVRGGAGAVAFDLGESTVWFGN